jgi:cytosine/uracil/thiamine/allantoin permease
VNPKHVVAFLAGVLTVWVVSTFIFGPPLHGAHFYGAWAATAALLVVLGMWIFKLVRR